MERIYLLVKEISRMKGIILMLCALVPSIISAQTQQMTTCPICGGNGSIFIIAEVPPMICLACNGSGKVPLATAEAYVRQKAMNEYSNGGNGNSSSSGSSTGKKKKDCKVCYNTGNCQTCYGRGEIINPYTGNWTYCNTCNKNYENAKNPNKKGKCYACSW